MAPAADRLSALSESQRQELESLLLNFEVTWTAEALAGCVEKLTSQDQDYRYVALVELVKIDLERQWQAGNHRSVEDYLQRFPELGTTATVAPELLLSEIQARRLRGEAVKPEVFAVRFPQQVDKLKHLFEQSSQSASHRLSGADTSREAEAMETQRESAAKPWSLPKEFGRYRILKLLGEGGMGSVYLAHDTELDRQVAIKVPKFSKGNDSQRIERFYREARAAAKLQNRHICAVHDVGEIQGVHHISMAYVAGRPLSAYIRTAHNQPERSVVLVVRRLSLALQEAHSQDVVHRDLKPANIMIDGKKEPVIMDFGLARQLDKHDDSRLTQQGSIMGSPAYMSPEQVAGEIDRVGPASDIYSLGVILFELLTGRVPFEGPMAAVLGQIMTQEAPRPSEFRQDMDPRLEQICLKMMAKRIKDRHANMQEVADALMDFLKGPGDEGLVEEIDAGVIAAGPDENQQLEEMFATQYARSAPGPPAHTAHDVTQRPTPSVWSRFGWPPVALGIAAGTLALVLFGVLILLRTPHGTLRIEVDDPQLIVSVDGDELTIEKLKEPQDLQVGTHRLAVKLGETTLPLGDKVRLKTTEYDGEYQLAVTFDGVAAVSETFTIVKGDQRVLTISLEKETAKPQTDPIGTIEAPRAESPKPSAPWSAILPTDAPPPAIAPFDTATAKQHQQAWAKYLGVPIERDVDLGDGVKLTRALIPPGEFDMGSTQEEVDRLLAKMKGVKDQGYLDRLPSEVPRHRVRLTKAFWLGTCEVTVGQFRQFVAETEYLTEGEKDGTGGHGPDASGKWEKKPETTWHRPGYAQSDDHAVVQVSWNDAIAFCKWLSRKDGTTSRLPTEAEWEYACRSGTTTGFYFGDDVSEPGDYAWLAGIHMTHPVGLKKPNTWGLYDMHGNVWEWCQDWFDEKYYAISPLDDPTGGLRNSSQRHVQRGWHDSRPRRVKRGASWGTGPAKGSQAARRSGVWPSTRSSHMGFRVATVLADNESGG